jgi:hypothetical protein
MLALADGLASDVSECSGSLEADRYSGRPDDFFNWEVPAAESFAMAPEPGLLSSERPCSSHWVHLRTVEGGTQPAEATCFTEIYF